MKYEIAITVDTNDADYNTATNEISQEQLDKIMPLIKAIKNTKESYNFEYGDIAEQGWEFPIRYSDKFSKDVTELFLEFLPSTQNGFHTIERIEIYPIPKKERLL